MIMFNKEKRQAKKEEKQAKIQAKLDAMYAKSDAKSAKRKEKIAMADKRIAEIDAHNKKVWNETMAEVKDIRQKGKQRRLNMINDAIHEGREQSNSQTTHTSQSNVSEELHQLKQLEADGIISAEEFEAKKKQLLGL